MLLIGRGWTEDRPFVKADFSPTIKLPGGLLQKWVMLRSQGNPRITGEGGA